MSEQELEELTPAAAEIMEDAEPALPAEPEMEPPLAGLDAESQFTQFEEPFSIPDAPGPESDAEPVMAPDAAPAAPGNLNQVLDVTVKVTAELGRTTMLIRDVVGLAPGTVVELNKLAGEPVDIRVNEKLLARGEVVVIDDSFGVRITEIVSGLPPAN